MGKEHAALTLNVLLRRTAVFHALSDDDFGVLAGVLRQRRLAPGEVLCSEGAPGDSMFIVAAGRLTVGQAAAPAHSELRPGDVTGEMACIDPAPRSATVTAATDATVYELDQALLRSLQQNAPGVATVVVGGIIGQLAARLRETNERLVRATASLRKPGAPPISGILPRPIIAPHEEGQVAAPLPYREKERPPLDLSALRAARGLSERDLELLLAVAPPQVYADGALLCLEGRPGSSCFLLAQGTLEVLKRVEGKQRVLGTLAPGALAGQVALIDRSARTATLRARGEVVVLTLAYEDFDKLIHARSPLGLRFQEQVAIAGIRQLRSSIERLAQVTNPGTGPAAVAAVAQVRAPVPARVDHGADAGGDETRPMSLDSIQTSLREWDMVLGELNKLSR